MPVKMPFASRCVFREDFLNLGSVQDNGGAVIAGAPIVDRGMQASGNSTDLLRYDRERNMLIGVTQASWNLKFRTGADIVQDNVPLSRYTAAGNGSFYFDIYGGGNLDGRLVNTGGADRLHRYTGILSNTYYDFTFTYNGASLAFLAYLNGAPVAFNSISGAFPTSLPIYGGPLEMFGLNAVRYARTGFKLYAAYVFTHTMSAAEVSDWYLNDTYRRVVP